MFKRGDKILFEGMKRSFTVQASNERYAVCTQPFNLKHTVLYTIVDLEKKIRGTENLVFCLGFETVKACEEALNRITKGDSEISYRNRVPLNITASPGI